MDKDEHPKTIGQRTTSLANVVRTGLFLSEKDNKVMSYVLEKTERIASAVTVLSGIIDDNQALRDGLREQAIGLVKDAARSGNSQGARRDLVEAVTTLAALLELARHSRELSEMNIDIIVFELQQLVELLQTFDWHSGRQFLPQSHFVLPALDVASERDMRETGSRAPQGLSKDSNKFSSREPAPTNRQTQKDMDTIEGESDKSHYRERVHDAQKDRRATILGMLQRKDRVTVKDVASVIKDCSEKTLQRELLALVAQGVLKKEGERRWSTYRLA